MASSVESQSSHVWDGMYAFVRAHILVINAVVLASSTLVGVLDFIAPRFQVLPKIVYSFTGMLVIAMLAFALAPSLSGKLLAALGLARASNSSMPAWRRPFWQLSIFILAGITLLGFESVAKASQGGVIASAFPSLRSFQSELLSLRGDVADIKSGVGEANAKLDRIAQTVDPAIAADRCADLDCALSNGASVDAVRKLLAKGAALPGNPVIGGALLMQAALSTSPTRLDTLDLLFQKGLDRDMVFLPHLTEPASLTKQGELASKEIFDAARLDIFMSHPFLGMRSANKSLEVWNQVGGCLYRTSGGVTVMQFASLLGDSELLSHLRAIGMSMPAQPLACSWSMSRSSGRARVRFDSGTGKFAGAESA